MNWELIFDQEKELSKEKLLIEINELQEKLNELTEEHTIFTEYLDIHEYNAKGNRNATVVEDELESLVEIEEEMYELKSEIETIKIELEYIESFTFSDWQELNNKQVV